MTAPDANEMLRRHGESALREHIDSGQPYTPKLNGHAAPFDAKGAIQLDDFVAYMPLHNYIYIPTREVWPGTSVNARIAPIDKSTQASAWLDANRPVEQMTWAP